MNSIIEDAYISGYVFEYTPDYKLQHNSTKGKDNEKIIDEIKKFKERFVPAAPIPGVPAVPNAMENVINTLAHKLEDTWHQLQENYNVPNPRERIVNFIDQLKLKLKNIHHINDAQKAELIVDINHKMQSIRDYAQQYARETGFSFFNQEDKSIGEAIFKFENKFKDTFDCTPELVECLENNVKTIQESASSPDNRPKQ